MPSYSRKYLSLLLLTETILQRAQKRAKATAGQFNLTLEICRDLPLPVPSSHEQKFIVETVETALTVIEKLQISVEAQLNRANSLRQAILQKAFSGQLVPQDPNDEPASVLLERILAERAAQGTAGKRGKEKTADEAQPRLLEVDA